MNAMCVLGYDEMVWYYVIMIINFLLWIVLEKF